MTHNGKNERIKRRYARYLKDAKRKSEATMRLPTGMPVEVFIETPPRTVLYYLTRPLTDQVRKAFREK